MGKSKRLRFELNVDSAGGPRAGFEVHRRFLPNGRTVLNKTAWRGKEPRSCGVTRISSRPHSMGDPSPFIFDIEVSYRPKGYTNYVSLTKYDGWTAMLLERRKDGVYLDAKGQPLKDGEAPIYSPKEIFHDVEFNDLDFGVFVEEVDVEDVKKLTRDEAISEVTDGGRSFNTTVASSFVAAHRYRPEKKIILSNAPSGRTSDLVNISLSTDHLEEVLMEELSNLMFEFVEGKVSIVAMSNDNATFVDLSGALVDCEPNEQGLESWFDMLHCYTPMGFMEDLAKRLMSVYAIDVSVVPGKDGGLVLRHEAKKA